MCKNACLLSSSSLAGQHRNFPAVSEGPSSTAMPFFVSQFNSLLSLLSIVYFWAGKLNGGSATASNVTRNDSNVGSEAPWSESHIASLKGWDEEVRVVNREHAGT